MRGASSSSQSAGTEWPARAAERAQPEVWLERGGRPGVAARARSCPEQPHSPAVPPSDLAPSVLINDLLSMISWAAANEPWFASRFWPRSSSSESDLRAAANGFGHEGHRFPFPAVGSRPTADALPVSLSLSIEGLTDIIVR